VCKWRHILSHEQYGLYCTCVHERHSTCRYTVLCQCQQNYVTPVCNTILTHSVDLQETHAWSIFCKQLPYRISWKSDNFQSLIMSATDRQNDVACTHCALRTEHLKTHKSVLPIYITPSTLTSLLQYGTSN